MASVWRTEGFYYICIVTTRGSSDERESPHIAPNIEIRTAFMASRLREVSEVAALKHQAVEQRVRPLSSHLRSLARRW